MKFELFVSFVLQRYYLFCFNKFSRFIFVLRNIKILLSMLIINTYCIRAKSSF